MPGMSPPFNHLLQALPAAELDSLRPRLESVELAKETVLVETGAPIRQVYLPHSGAVSMMVTFPEGQTVQVAMIGRDSIIGGSAALDGGPLLADAVVVVPGIASVLKVEDFRAAFHRSSALRNLVARHQQALFAQAQQSAACSTSHSVESRLSRWLLRARDLCASEGLPVTQELLAQLIGVRRNAISIVAHAFQQAGIIRYGRGQIEITDIEALRNTSCECYDAVKTQCDRLLNAPD
jgi:CRP-like cAMP-binding protein